MGIEKEGRLWLLCEREKLERAPRMEEERKLVGGPQSKRGLGSTLATPGVVEQVWQVEKEKKGQ